MTSLPRVCIMDVFEGYVQSWPCYLQKMQITTTSLLGNTFHITDIVLGISERMASNYYTETPTKILHQSFKRNFAKRKYFISRSMQISRSRLRAFDYTIEIIVFFVCHQSPSHHQQISCQINVSDQLPNAIRTSSWMKLMGLSSALTKGTFGGSKQIILILKWNYESHDAVCIYLIDSINQDSS